MREKRFTQYELQRIKKQVYTNHDVAMKDIAPFSFQTIIDLIDECLLLQEKVDGFEYILRLKKMTEEEKRIE